LDELKDEEAQLLWNHRGYLLSIPTSLPALIRSTPFDQPNALQQLYKLLSAWGRIHPNLALALLGREVQDTVVREYAVDCFCQLNDHQLLNCLLQLIQALKFERSHDSQLGRFLLYRALHNRSLVGHYFFWALQAEIGKQGDIELNSSPPPLSSSPSSSAPSSSASSLPGLHLNVHSYECNERYLALLESYVEGCGDQLGDLVEQMGVVSRLRQLARQIKQLKKEKREREIQSEMSQANSLLPQTFRLPLDPRLSVSSFIVEKCRAMSSNTVPLWLTLRNADPYGQPVVVIFKSGDDLRQDILTLQLFGLMDQLWQEEGFDLHMTVYRCVSTSVGEGFIEVVPNAATASKIQKDAAGLAGALQKTPLANWLHKHNTTEADFSFAVDNFVRSCAGYCVASYVIGLGDRHNDNVMITQDGHLFHIDFAHFLGNIMKFGAYKREKAPFVFTSEFVHVMGGTQSQMYQHFIDLCCVAYNIIRKNANVFICYLLMMLSAGLEQLQTKADIQYVRDALPPYLSEDAAACLFIVLVKESLESKTTKILFFMHNLAHLD
jgi:hypothetical protein